MEYYPTQKRDYVTIMDMISTTSMGTVMEATVVILIQIKYFKPFLAQVDLECSNTLVLVDREGCLEDSLSSLVKIVLCNVKK